MRRFGDPGRNGRHELRCYDARPNSTSDPVGTLMTASLRRALSCAAFLVACTGSLSAQTAVDGSPFSADPQALLAAAKKIETKDQNVVYLLDEQTISFETNGRTKSVSRVIEYVVTADVAGTPGTGSGGWVPG